MALGEQRFLTPEEKKTQAVEHWARQEKQLTEEQVELFLMLYDFKQKNPDLTVEQLFNSQLLTYRGGLPRVKSLFGDLQKFLDLYEEAKTITPLDA